MQGFLFSDKLDLTPDVPKDLGDIPPEGFDTGLPFKCTTPELSFAEALRQFEDCALLHPTIAYRRHDRPREPLQRSEVPASQLPFFDIVKGTIDMERKSIQEGPLKKLLESQRPQKNQFPTRYPQKYLTGLRAVNHYKVTLRLLSLLYPSQCLNDHPDT